MVVDDQLVVRSGFVAVIGAEPDMEVVGEAGDGAAAVELAERLRPDIVVMDVRMPGVDGLTATRLITALDDAPRILILTTFDLDAYVYEALRSGASGFLLKDARAEDLLGAIRVVAAGDGMLAPSVTGRLIHSFAQGPPAAADTSGVLSRITPRERQILRLVASGMTNAEISDDLDVAVGTVKTHVNRILTKLELRDRVQATILAYDIGLVRPSDFRAP
ncbi:response regulator [Streptomyces sp. NPDC001922]|uniref:response regulator n=1 Tax=Streptomyces sp. NPDC001922 TaxID=3364624 RepID=UPI0036BE08F0